MRISGARTSSPAKGSWSDAEGPGRRERVVVGLSGGVDSAVAALELVRRGCEVLAVTTKNFCFDEAPFDAGATAGSCCSAEATEAAREVSAELGIAHTVLDASAGFHAEVIADYVRELHAGRTPSPCVLCNEKVRFPHLMAFADRVDARWVATGHYARTVRHVGGERYVARGVDRGKDQSYFLYRLPERMLRRISFPLGTFHKDEVRARARRHGLPVAQAPDSQELCFVPDGDRSRVLGEGRGPGDVVDEIGRVLGRHPGIEHFTVGQRRGIGIGGPRTWYVSALDAERNCVVVAERARLRRRVLDCVEWILRDPERRAEGLVARTRHRHRGTAVTSLRTECDRLRITLAEPDLGPAPGQAVVLYREGVVVGGGRLQAATEGSRE
jgi:tRNA-specific 2-thiouridylase